MEREMSLTSTDILHELMSLWLFVTSSLQRGDDLILTSFISHLL